MLADSGPSILQIIIMLASKQELILGTSGNVGQHSGQLQRILNSVIREDTKLVYIETIAVVSTKISLQAK